MPPYTSVIERNKCAKTPRLNGSTVITGHVAQRPERVLNNVVGLAKVEHAAELLRDTAFKQRGAALGGYGEVSKNL